MLSTHKHKQTVLIKSLMNQHLAAELTQWSTQCMKS